MFCKPQRHGLQFTNSIAPPPPTDKRNNEEFRPTDKPKSGGDRTQMFNGLMRIIDSDGANYDWHQPA